MSATIVEDRSLPPADKLPSVDGAKQRQILDGARQVFRAAGFDAASMGEIAKAAGVSKGTLYVYFDSKEALFEALTLSERRWLAEALFSLDENDADVAAALTKLGRTFLAAMVKPDHISSVRMVIGSADRFPRFGRSFYEAGPCCGAWRLGAYLDRQVAAGRLLIDDTTLAAEQFFGMCSSGAFKRLLFAAADRIDEAEIGRVVAGGVRVFMAAYGTGQKSD